MALNLELSRYSRSHLTGLLAFVFCIAFLGIINFVYFGVIQNIWAKKPEVDRLTCECSCWDTIFKGSYENPPARYKHVYFNVTWQTFIIWLLTVLAILITYEVFRHIVRVLLFRRFRVSMFILFISTVHSHYYSWWAIFGYLNDDFYKQWNHQMLFTVTEGISTAVALHLLDDDVIIKSRHLLVMLSIAILHLLAGSIDQFVNNVILGEGAYFQISRDIAFFSVDLLYLIIVTQQFYLYLRNDNLGLSMYILRSWRDLFFACIVVFVLLLFLQFL